MIRVTVLASGEHREFRTTEAAENWWMPRYGRSSVCIDDETWAPVAGEPHEEDTCDLFNW